MKHEFHNIPNSHTNPIPLDIPGGLIVFIGLALFWLIFIYILVWR